MPESPRDEPTAYNKCRHPACKCAADMGKCCCESCSKVEQSEGEQCNCGHKECEIISQMRSESKVAFSES